MRIRILDARRHILSIIVVTVVAAAPGALAQTPNPPAPTFTIDQAIGYAIEHYPTVRAALEQVNASTAGVSVAKSAYLPRLDSLWQSNRATANNIFGQVLPQSVIPAMSGPVLPAASSGSVWGSAAGALFSWEPVDFGLRQATVSAAEAATARARAGEALTRLDVQAAVAATFLNIVGAQRTVAALQADLDRRDRPVSRRPRPGRQSTAARRGGVTQRRRAGGGPDTTDSGATEPSRLDRSRSRGFSGSPAARCRSIRRRWRIVCRPAM